MRRRDFIKVIAGPAIGWPLAARAQRRVIPVIGFLAGASPDTYSGITAAFLQGLKETGYVERQNQAIEYRWAEDHYDRLPALAADLVHREVARSAQTKCAKDSHYQAWGEPPFRARKRRGRALKQR